MEKRIPKSNTPGLSRSELKEKHEWKIKKLRNQKKIVEEIDKENHEEFPNYRRRNDYTKQR